MFDRGHQNRLQWLCSRARAIPSRELADRIGEHGNHVCASWRHFGRNACDLGDEPIPTPPNPPPLTKLDLIQVLEARGANKLIASRAQTLCFWAAPRRSRN